MKRCGPWNIIYIAPKYVELSSLEHHSIIAPKSSVKLFFWTNSWTVFKPHLAIELKLIMKEQLLFHQLPVFKPTSIKSFSHTKPNFSTRVKKFKSNHICTF
ncbi:uncharacterized protein LOC133745761 [Rosa rugosa]|uniref:uncharacterized protein LOC133745761 n=1 Tax=Rosa rugosa TaxID=74645 RepID=UPI002B40AD33|nr:uncharacterized protein LOC133745761 [Rosa rugosa]